MSRLISISFPPANATLFGTNLSGAGLISIVPLNYPLIFPNFARNITLSSTGNLSLLTFTIVGTDQYGNVIDEGIVGPNADSVTSVNQYHTIARIYANGNYDALTIGSATTGTSQWIKVNTFNIDPNITIATEVTGAVNYSFFQTIDQLEQVTNISSNIGQGSTLSYVVDSTPVTYPVTATLTAATTKQLYTMTTPTMAIQVVVNSSTAGTLTVNILQQGII
jgi:hypothetical protein